MIIIDLDAFRHQANRKPGRKECRRLQKQTDENLLILLVLWYLGQLFQGVPFHLQIKLNSVQTCPEGHDNTVLILSVWSLWLNFVISKDVGTQQDQFFLKIVQKLKNESILPSFTPLGQYLVSEAMCKLNLQV